MSRPSLFVPKFVGSISLGLLTGLSLTLSQTTLPTLLSFPTLPPALSSFTILRTTSTQQKNLLSILASTSLLAAYVVAPRGQKQPYLLWALSTVGLGLWGVDSVLEWRESAGKKSVKGISRKHKQKASRHTDEESEEEEEVNGEAVREEIEGWRREERLRAGVWGVGWAMCVVGIWGDAY